MKQRLIAIACLALSAAPVTAQSLHGASRLAVTPVAGGFAVENDLEHGARGMWCAAAGFARATGATAPKQRIYVAQPRPAGIGQRGQVVFTTDPSGLAPRSALITGLSLARAGSSMSVAHGESLCNALRGGRR